MMGWRFAGGRREEPSVDVRPFAEIVTSNYSKPPMYKPVPLPDCVCKSDIKNLTTFHRKNDI